MTRIICWLLGCNWYHVSKREWYGGKLVESSDVTKCDRCERVK